MTPLPAPSPTGVRIAGDMYQWAHVWAGCLAMLRDTAATEAGGITQHPILSIEVEADGAGNLDDLVLYRARPPHSYGQVKYTVDASSPVNEDYLTRPTSTGGPCLLKKIARAWRRVTTTGDPADLALITNRAPDPADPLIRLRDSRTQLLLPRTTPRGPRSNTSQALDRWARAAGLTRAELLDLLAVLRFDLARDPQHLQEHIQLLMLAAGLRTDQAAIHLATDWVARKVRDGHRELTPAMVHQALDELGLHAGTSRAIISIATLTPDLAASDADHALDWVDRFEGDSPYTKRRPRPPATWEQLQRDIEAIPGQLTPGAAAIAITGTFRLAPAFLTGSAFRMVTGVDVGILQRGQLWNSNEAYDAPLAPDIGENELAQGDDLAVAVAIATDPTDDVLTFLREQALPVRRLLTLYPPGGPKDNAVPDAATASALAVGIRDTLRGTLRRASRQTPHIHLFQASPRGLAVLLGHRWNRLRPTTVYEDTATTYDAAFTVDA